MTVYNFQQATFLALGKKPLRLLAKHWRGYTKDKNFVFIDVFIDIYYLLLVFTLKALSLKQFILYIFGTNQRYNFILKNANIEELIIILPRKRFIILGFLAILLVKFYSKLCLFV